MSDETTLVTARGKESSSRTTAKVDAAQKLDRKLNRLGLMAVGDAWTEDHVARPGRFYATAGVKARPRR